MLGKGRPFILEVTIFLVSYFSNILFYSSFSHLLGCLTNLPILPYLPQLFLMLFLFFFPSSLLFSLSSLYLWLSDFSLPFYILPLFLFPMSLHISLSLLFSSSSSSPLSSLLYIYYLRFQILFLSLQLTNTKCVSPHALGDIEKAVNSAENAKLSVSELQVRDVFPSTFLYSFFQLPLEYYFISFWFFPFLNTLLQIFIYQYFLSTLLKYQYRFIDFYTAISFY